LQAVHDIPPGADLPPMQNLVSDRPASWQGLPIKWTSTNSPVPVFIERFRVPKGGADDAVFLLGARYSLLEALVGGESLGDGHFVEYFVATKHSDRAWAVHRLLQRQSVTFSETEEREDYFPALEIDDPRALSLGPPPDWEETEAIWPTCTGAPMQFVGQIDLPETTVTRELLTWGVALYLFWSQSNRDDCFKLVEQETDAQTVEEHYKSE
jgi:hypothetical protein